MSEKKSNNALIIRIVALLVIGGVAIGLRYNQRRQRIAENERRAAQQPTVVEIVVEEEEPVDATGIPESQKTPLMKKADQLTIQVDELEKKIAIETRMLNDMDAWLRAFEAKELQVTDPAQLDQNKKLYETNLEKRDAQKEKVDAANEELTKLKYELANTRLDIVTKGL